MRIININLPLTYETYLRTYASDFDLKACKFAFCGVGHRCANSIQSTDDFNTRFAAIVETNEKIEQN